MVGSPAPREDALMQPGGLGGQITQKPGRLLCAIGADEHAERLVRATRRFASVTGLRPSFIHVIGGRTSDRSAGAVWVGRSLLRSAGVRTGEMHVAVGQPTPEILRCADAEDAALILVAARGFGPLKGPLLGSVSRTLMEQARIPVMILPPAADPSFEGSHVLHGDPPGSGSSSAGLVAAGLARLLGQEVSSAEVVERDRQHHVEVDQLDRLATAVAADIVVLTSPAGDEPLLDAPLGVRFANRGRRPLVLVPRALDDARPAA